MLLWTNINNVVFVVCPATFSTNPQFRVKLDIDSDGDKQCSVLVALMQKGTRTEKQRGFEGYEIGFNVYEVSSVNTVLTKAV